MYDKNTFCQAWDQRCNGCVYEKRWNKLISLPFKDRADRQLEMTPLDPRDCVEMGMVWKLTKE